MSANLMQRTANEAILFSHRSFTDFCFFHSVSHREPSRSSSCCLLFSSSHEIPSSSPAGLCFLKKGKKTQRIFNYSTFPIGKWSRDLPTESPADGLTGLLLLSCRYVSDAVTGVIIVSVLFFFPSQKPSLSWWFDPQGQWPPRKRPHESIVFIYCMF